MSITLTSLSMTFKTGLSALKADNGMDRMTSIANLRSATAEFEFGSGAIVFLLLVVMSIFNNPATCLAKEHPNVVIFLADDAGWGDYSQICLPEIYLAILYKLLHSFIKPELLT